MGVDLAHSFMVGDRWRDVEAGRRAGCATVYVDRGYDERRAEGFDAAVPGLPEAADWIPRNGVGRDDEPASQSTAPDLAALRVKIFADGADLNGIVELARKPIIKGFTTNLV